MMWVLQCKSAHCDQGSSLLGTDRYEEGEREVRGGTRFKGGFEGRVGSGKGQEAFNKAGAIVIAVPPRGWVSVEILTVLQEGYDTKMYSH